MAHTKSGRIVSFDGLRGIAALAVVLFHYCSLQTPSNILHPIFHYGTLGVILFFIISGFVISFTINKCRNVAHFTYARFARLYPVYWASIIFVFFLNTFLIMKKIPFSVYMGNLLMFQDLAHIPDVNAVYWTLQYELLFYCFIATLFYFKLFSKNLPFIIWGIAAFSWLLLQSYGLIDFPSITSQIGHFLILTYAPLFIFGVYLYKCYSEGWKLRHGLMLIAMAVIFTELYPLLHMDSYNPQTMKIYLFFIFLFSAYAAYRPEGKILSNKIMQFFGKISYSLYLTHYILGFAIFNVILPRIAVVPAILIAFSFSIVVGFLFNRLIEIPSHRYLVGIYKKKSEKSNAMVATSA